MEADKKILKAKVQLILANPFFATLALKMDYVSDDSISTACTDGKSIRYNPTYINKLDVEETKALISHECLHNGMLHNTRRQGRNPRKFNIAADYAINPLLVDSGFKLPKGALIDKQFKDKSAEEIYNILPDEPEYGDSGAGNDPGMCGGVSDSPAKTQSEVNQIEAEIKQTLAQAAAVAKQQGKLPAGLARMVDEVLEPKVNWKDVLSRFLTEIAKNDYTFKKPSPRYLHAGLYLPALESIETGEVVLIVDTSGSIDRPLLSQFGAEMQDILSAFGRGFNILYVDTEVAGTQFIEPDEEFALDPKGGGGTDFTPGFDWIEKEGIEPSAVVYLTDGECNSFPNTPDYPVLWAVVNNKRFSPPFGETVPL